jgi:hypothetical protein
LVCPEIIKTKHNKKCVLIDINNELNIFYQKDKNNYYDLVSRYLNTVMKMNDFEMVELINLFFTKKVQNDTYLYNFTEISKFYFLFIKFFLSKKP